MEKVSPKTKAEDRFSTYKICEKCRQKAKDHINRSVTVLPDTVDPSIMVRTEGPRGRCDVCHQGEIKWYDKENHLEMCQICYSQEIISKVKI